MKKIIELTNTEIININGGFKYFENDTNFNNYTNSYFLKDQDNKKINLDKKISDEIMLNKWDGLTDALKNDIERFDTEDILYLTKKKISSGDFENRGISSTDKISNFMGKWHIKDENGEEKMTFTSTKAMGQFVGDSIDEPLAYLHENIDKKPSSTLTTVGIIGCTTAGCAIMSGVFLYFIK